MIYGTVKKGIGAGHSGWGMHTANIQTINSMDWGFYLCDVYIDFLPTYRGFAFVTPPDPYLIEVYISKFSGDLYGKKISLDNLVHLTTRELEEMFDKIIKDF